MATSLIGFGMASVLDTLATQAHGYENGERLAALLLRSAFAVSLTALPIGALWWSTERCLLPLGQDPRIAALAGTYVRTQLPGLWPFLMYQVLTKWLQAQEIVAPSMAVGLAANALNVASNWFFIFKLDMGFIGAPIATSLSRTFLFGGLLWYCWAYGLLKPFGVARTWERALTRVGVREYCGLAVSAVGMLCFEAWGFEFTTMLAGLLGSVSLAAHEVAYNILDVGFAFAVGTSVAASTGVGTLIGRGDAAGARRYSVVVIATSLATTMLAGCVLSGVRHRIGGVFSTDPAVLEALKPLLPVLITFLSLDSLQTTTGGALRGAGRPGMGAIVQFSGFYLVGLPLGAHLAFRRGLGVAGLWYGLAVGLGCVSAALLLALSRTDWEARARDAVARCAADAPAVGGVAGGGGGGGSGGGGAAPPVEGGVLV
jgi:MATE family multidrug resistance protein